jgi:hypothetical protein
MKDPDPLNLRPDDVMVKWRRDAIRDEEARRAAKREQQQREEQNAVAQLRAEVQQEVANLRAEMQQLHEVHIEVTGTTLGEYGDKIYDHFQKAIRELHNDVFSEIAQKFGEAMGRLDALVSGAPSRSKGFKFANEPDDDNVADLPNPLRKGMN